MSNYLAGRLISSLIALILVTFIVFVAVRFLPGDVVDFLTQGLANAEGTEELRDELGLNDPLPIAYAEWLGNAVTLDLGDSLVSDRSVVDLIQERLPATIELAVLTLIISILVAFPIGVLSAVARGTFIDYITRGMAILLVSVPFFWIATLTFVVPSRLWGWVPPRGYENFWDDPIQNLTVLIIPASILGLSLSGRTMRMMRTTVLEVLGLDYVRTARAKGLPERMVLVRHTMRNAMIPVVTILGLEFTFLIGGTVVMETLFAIPGLGALMLFSLQTRDYTVVMGILVVFAIMLIAINLIVDLSYGFLNPRVRG